MVRKRRLDRLTTRKSLDLKDITLVTVELPNVVTGIIEDSSDITDTTKPRKINLSSRPGVARQKALHNLVHSLPLNIKSNKARTGSLLIEGIIEPLGTNVGSGSGSVETFNSILENRRGLLSIFLVKDKVILNSLEAQDLRKNIPINLRTSTRTPYEASLVGLRAVLGGVEVELLAEANIDSDSK